MEAFEALADPSRRRIVELLAGRDLTAGEVAAQFAVSRPAVSRHLRVLRECGVVHSRVEAQRRVYRLDPGSLAEVDAWVQHCRRTWTARLDRLQSVLEDER
jgi:DNA-binding transcriptional ArsR family regulator